MSCFICVTLGTGHPQNAIEVHDLAVAFYLMGRSIGGLPEELRTKAELMLCSEHDALIHKTISDAMKLGAGMPEFELMKPSLLRAAPPRLRQVK